MAGTQLVAVRKWVVAGLIALEDEPDPKPFADVLVTFAWKVGASHREKVFTKQGAFDHQPAVFKSGRTNRDETATFEVVILVEGVGKSPEWASERAVELGTFFEEFVSDNRVPGGSLPLVNWVNVQGRGDLVEMFNDRGSLAELTYTVTYNARLT